MSRAGIGRHKSLDKELRVPVKWLRSLPGIEKVIYGHCDPCRHRRKPGTLELRREIPVGFELQAYGGFGVMRLIVHIKYDRRLELRSLITARCRK